MQNSFSIPMPVVDRFPASIPYLAAAVVFLDFWIFVLSVSAAVVIGATDAVAAGIACIIVFLSVGPAFCFVVRYDDAYLAAKIFVPTFGAASSVQLGFGIVLTAVGGIYWLAVVIAVFAAGKFTACACMAILIDAKSDAETIPLLPSTSL